MKKVLTFGYPFILTILSYVCYTVLALIINTSDIEGYGGLGIALLIIGLWLLIALPIGCYLYVRLIRHNKYKVLLATYNCVVVTFSYIFPFISEEETYYFGAALFIWAEIWSLMFVAIYKKQRSNETEAK